MKDPLDDLIEKEGQWLEVYMGIETIDDAFEKNVITTNINPISIKAFVSDQVASKAQWIMIGIKVSQIKEIYFAKKYRGLIEASQKIGLRNNHGSTDYFEGWRENSKMQIREEGEYLRVYIYSKHT